MCKLSNVRIESENIATKNVISCANFRAIITEELKYIKIESNGTSNMQ